MQQRIFYALEEIKLTHDLVSRMLPSTNSEPPISSRIHIPPRPTPSNSQQQQASATAQTKLKVSMVPQKPPLPIQSQVESIQLTLSSKREHAITVSKYFEDAFRRLQGAQQREHQFYSQYTLNLMRHRWIPQSDYFGAGPGRSFRNLHVDYGLRGAGSFLKDVTRAELVRETGSADGTEDDLHHEDAVELWIPHNVSKVVEVRLDSAMKEKGEDGRPSEQRAVPESWSRFSDHSPMTPMRMLANAQLTVFYTDLFNAISFEMTKNHSTTKGARTFAKTISIPLQADRVLNISLVSRRVESAKPQSLPSLIPGDPSFDHALMQLGLERALRSQQSELMKRLQSERRPTLNVPDSNSIPIMGGILRWVLFWDRCRQIDSIIKPSVLRKAVLQHSASSDRGPVGPLPILSVMRNSKPDEGGQGCQVRWTISSGGKRCRLALEWNGVLNIRRSHHPFPKL
ncbi:hypothetical protein BJ742DRAFT_550119 [Cladochytrium replicatum]|nr:hypothetical protein BJ742DRAFT_550119 [Cladochytrium replicatum]